jgi:hypothetical protein
MGAHNITIEVPKSKIRSPLKLETWWQKRVEEDWYENGHDPYSGGIGTMGDDLVFTGLTFKNSEEAEKYILDHHEKWRPALVVSFKEDGKQYWMVGGWAAE